MPSREAIAIRRLEALRQIRDVLQKYDPESEGRLRKTYRGNSLPTSERRVSEFGAYLAECVASLSRIVDEQLTPRKRGRPKKTTQ
jgi:hypothetical protein